MYKNGNPGMRHLNVANQTTQLIALSEHSDAATFPKNYVCLGFEVRLTLVKSRWLFGFISSWI